MCTYCVASTIESNGDKASDTTEIAIYLSILFFAVVLCNHYKDVFSLKIFHSPSTLDQLEDWTKKRDKTKI